VLSATALVLIGPAAAAGPALKPTSPPEGGYTLLLPVGWQLAKTPKPKHAHHIWRDPASPEARVIVALSSCRTCVTNPKTRAPDPNHALPAHVSSRTHLNRWQVIYTLKRQRGSYRDRGTIIILHARNRITGYARIDTQLPSELQPTSTAILTSFHLRQ